ncbi:hypothetical protein [Haloarchaeobius salinus]|uniref:hypothetical protein n=1 Tax=Haloarchaeobius salinus TaxID=1198298 RepID=UPI00210CAA54|nr:hypothetical protein [Haloarchaeobius salinus]
MQRRALLTAFATGAAGLAGCLQGPLDIAGGSSDAPTDGWSAERPCPTFDAAADRTVCTGGGHPAPSGVPVAVHPPAATPLRAGTSFALTLRPQGDVPLTFAPGDWTVRRRGEDGWIDVASGAAADGFATVYPGERYEWLVGGAEPVATADGAARIGASFDPGRYAFSLTASVGRGWTRGERFGCVALFAVRRP